MRSHLESGWRGLFHSPCRLVVQHPMKIDLFPRPHSVRRCRLAQACRLIPTTFPHAAATTAGEELHDTLALRLPTQSRLLFLQQNSPEKTQPDRGNSPATSHLHPL
eukprot:Lithocolla_globosa_v1_NODE_1058_length_2905_cov_16.696491.p7 type:complete len:106 gc:universal NODE_1058_length_2905_cov_16.696491:2332-2649(+)